VATLLYFGWKLDFGWIEDPDPLAKEKEIKKTYKERHGDVLPALVRR